MSSCAGTRCPQSVPRSSLYFTRRDVNLTVAPCSSGNADISARTADGSISRRLDGASGLYEEIAELDRHVGHVLQRSCRVWRAPLTVYSVHELDESELWRR